jgi:hypothetical protein
MCTVCAHPSRIEIERDLLARPSAAAVAACHRLPLEDVKKHKVRLQARIEHTQRQLEQNRLADSLARLQLIPLPGALEAATVLQTFTDLGTTTTLEKALAPADLSTLSMDNRAGPN